MLAALAASLLCEPLAGLAADEPTRAAPADVGAGRAHFQRGVELYRSGAHDAALAAFRRAVALLPELAVSYREIAYTHSLRKTLDEGRADYDRPH